MKCPCCGATIESSQQQYQARQLAQGHCPKCGKPNDGPYVTCRDCRMKNNAQRRQRYESLRGVGKVLSGLGK